MSPVAPPPVVPAELADRRRPGDPVPVRRRGGRTGRLVVACILDEFSAAAFGDEADLAPLTMGNWLVELTAAQPDLLLVESAWRGHRQSWWNTVHRAGPELEGILDWCRGRGIPTAFWNKEDPVHFNTFLTAASRFDVVFTTDLDCVPRYKQELGHERVHFLPFAAQPVASNPAEAFDRVEGCAFAGAYYERYPERVADLLELGRELTAEGRRFDIYDRNHGRDTPGYAFPPEYRDHIVGGALTPDLLDIPYKGYTSNLNLNSVKQSQSMFARRVFELMASNTLVVSNFSRGLRLMFGDLVIATDSGREMRRRLRVLESAPNGDERLRGMALRAVLREHTYAERLEFVAAAAGVELPPAAVERPLLVVPGGDGVADLVRRWHGQSWSDWVLAVVGRPDASLPQDPRVVVVGTASAAADLARERGCTSLGLLDPRDWHGPHYLEDLLLTLRWADVPACGHVEHYAAVDGAAPERRRAGEGWALAEDLRLDRSLLRVEDWAAPSWSGEGVDLHTARPATGWGLAVGTLEFCADGARLPDAGLEPVRALELDTGLGLRRMRAHADALVLPEAPVEVPTLDLDQVLGGLDAWGDFTLTWTDAGARIESVKPVGRHQYWVSPHVHPLDAQTREALDELYLDVGVGLDVMLVAFWLDAGGQRVGHTMIPARRQRRLEIPDGAVRMQWALRISGPGTALVHRVVRGPYAAPPVPLLLRGDHLVVSNIYPSYANLYRNGFVHTRLRGYRGRGARPEVAVLQGASAPPRFREFEDVDVAEVGPEDLAATLAMGEVMSLSVHALLPPLWEVLRACTSLPPTTVWVHGFEIQPWWRRRFNHPTEEELEEARRTTSERLEMWRDVFTTSPDHVHFVFVSRTFAEEVFEDLGMRLPPERWSVIHNPIDGVVFPYRRKAAADRLRILSLRPYASRVYANDLAVAAVLDLRDDPGFEELAFTFIGDGPLFEETVAPLRGLSNVEVRRGFLTQAQIAEEHARHGVLLVPSRADTQGVSRDEAMSSGLVPVTTAVGAIPEFVDDGCAVLAPPEDHRALADGIRRLRDDPELFLRMSEAAAARVRHQSGADHILDVELALVSRRPGAPDGASPADGDVDVDRLAGGGRVGA